MTRLPLRLLVTVDRDATRAQVVRALSDALGAHAQEGRPTVLLCSEVDGTSQRVWAAWVGVWPELYRPAKILTRTQAANAKTDVHVTVTATPRGTTLEDAA